MRYFLSELKKRSINMTEGLRGRQTRAVASDAKECNLNKITQL